MAESPTLSHLFPAGAQRGSTTVVTCHGDFDWPVEIWSPGVNVTAAEEKGKFTISIPNDIAADRIWLRLRNAEGVSAAIPFLVGSLRETHEIEPNDAPRTAQKLSEFAPPPSDAEVTINGVLKKTDDVDGFAVQLERGQTLVAAVAANTHFGSPMDAILQIVSLDGTVLAENHDDVGLDPRIGFTAKESGAYIVRLFAFPAAPDQRIEFRGGDDYVYRLTLTTGPFITHTIPMSVSQDGPGTVEVLGWNIPLGTRLPVVCLDPSGGDGIQEIEPMSTRSLQSRIGFVRAPGWAGSARVRLVGHDVTSTLCTTQEQSPMRISPNNAVSGLVRTPRHKDFYLVPLKKDQEVCIAVESVSLASPLVPLVSLTDPTGNVAAEVLESGAASDALITHKAKHDGDYLLTVGDRYQHGGERYFYRLSIVPKQTDFELSLETDAIVLTKEKSVEVPVTIKREVASNVAIGNVTIEAIDVPDEVSCSAVVSEPKGDTAGKVTLKLETTGKPFSGLIRIRGKAVDSKIERFAKTPAKFNARFDRFWLTVTEEKPSGP